MPTPVRNPRLSLCVVVRDRFAGLHRSLIALEDHRQSLQDCGAEVVVVDGESQDGSADRAQAFARAMQDHFSVSVYVLPPHGIYAAMNQAIQLARGEWLLFLNAGDLLLDGGLLGEAMTAAEVVGATSIQCQMALFPPGGRRAFWLPGRPVRAHQSLLYRRDLHQCYGTYDVRLQVCADTLFMQAIEGEHQLIWPRLLAATDVSPADASRDPHRVRQDLEFIALERLPLQPWPHPLFTILLLRLERLVGSSLSVWLRLALARLRGRARMVPLG